MSDFAEALFGVMVVMFVGFCLLFAKATFNLILTPEGEPRLRDLIRSYFKPIMPSAPTSALVLDLSSDKIKMAALPPPPNTEVVKDNVDHRLLCMV
ncbi:hypothetical protein CsatB_024699 [Cannabis sativa]